MSNSIESSCLYIYYVCTVLTGLILYYIYNILYSNEPRVITGNKQLANFLQANMPTLKKPYKAPWFAFEGRIHSGLGGLIRMSEAETLRYERQIINLKDGGQLALDFLWQKDFNNNKNKNRLLVLIIPGLTSCSNTNHIKTLALSVNKTGANVVVFNNRGLGGVPLKTPRTYCVTNSEDLQEVIQHLLKLNSNSKMLVIGASFGGMTLCRYLIDFPEQAKETFLAAVVISICWDPIVGNANLEKSFLNKYIVNYCLALNLRKTAITNKAMLQANCRLDFSKIMKASTIREYDNEVTVPMFQFTSWEEYYTKAQISQYIHKISIPLIGLNAMDDPMQPGEKLPFAEAKQENSNLALIVTNQGGHLGFLQGVFPLRNKMHFMEKVVQEFVLAVQRGRESDNWKDILLKRK